MATLRLPLEEAEDGRWPPVCMVCGERATDYPSKTMSWHPPWVMILIVAGLLPFLIAALVTQKRAQVVGSFCPNHRMHWLGRTLATWLSLLGLLIPAVIGVILSANKPVGVVGGPQRNDDYFGLVCLGSLLFLLGWLVLVAILQTTAIRPKEITDRHILLTGVSPHFIAALEDRLYGEERRRREDRLRDARRDWEDTHRRPDEGSEQIRPRPHGDEDTDYYDRRPADGR